MPSRGRLWYRAAKHQAQQLFAANHPVSQVCAELELARSTAYRWRAEMPAHPDLLAPPCRPVALDLPASAPDVAPSVRAMIQRELPDLARVLLDQAKRGDTRAIGLLLKLVGDDLATDPQGDLDAHIQAAITEFEQELETVSPLLASQILGLIVRASERAAARRAGALEPSLQAHHEAMRLPWLAEAEPSDEGPDPL